MAENDIDMMIEELEGAGIDDDGVCAKYRPMMDDVPILIDALKTYKVSLAEDKNKMEAVAQLFGKKLGERFQVKIDNQKYDCSFEEYGFNSYGAYENPYLSFDTFILQELLTGTAVIISE